MKRRIIQKIAILIFILLLFIVVMQQNLISESKKNQIADDYQMSDGFRRMELSAHMLAFLQKESEYIGRDTGLYLLETKNGSLKFHHKYSTAVFEKLEKDWKKMPNYLEYRNTCIQIWDDVKCFPIPAAMNDKCATVSYTDSWLYDRKYREGNVHEGTDVMADINKRGYYPIISMTDGEVTNLGWLELGGYRVGVTTKSGAYFYYAHLSSYANLKEGMKLKAGDLIGFMGDSGYSKKEGTVGKFPVHLHVGIYLYPNGREVSINPYAVLRYSEKRKLSCIYR